MAGNMEALSNVQVCEDRSDCVELLQSAGLYLKPHARISITVTLPKLKTGQTISNNEIMEKLRQAIKPVKFSSIKVTKSSLEFVRFDAEINNKSNVEAVIKKIDLKGIRLSGFTELLKIRAAEGKVNFPTRHDWDSFFRDAKHMNEMKAGERPDTVVFKGLPIRWFSQFAGPASNRPSDQLMHRIMSQFGEVRFIDIPTNDPLRSKMSAPVSGLTAASLSHKDILFTCFVQFREYIGFAKCMHDFQGKKLVYVEDDKAWSCYIEVDFDRTKHLTDYSIKKRKEERERLQALDKEKEEKLRKQKEQELAAQQQERDRENAMLQAHQEKKELKKREKAERREKREQMRRSKKMKQLDTGEDVSLALKIASEERKLLTAQRRLESIRLLDELFDRIRVVRQRGDVSKKKDESTPDKKGKKSHEREEAKRMADQEQELRDKLVTSLKQRQEAVIGHHQRQVTKAQMGQFRLSSVVPKESLDTLSSISSRSIDGRSDSSGSNSDTDAEDKKENNQSNQPVPGPPPVGPGLMGPVPGMPPPIPGPPGFHPNWGPPPPHMQIPPQPFPPQGPPPADGPPPNYPSFYQPFPPSGPPIGEGNGPPPGPMCGPEGPPPNFVMPFFDGPPPGYFNRGRGFPPRGWRGDFRGRGGWEGDRGGMMRGNFRGRRPYQQYISAEVQAEIEQKKQDGKLFWFKRGAILNESDRSSRSRSRSRSRKRRSRSRGWSWSSRSRSRSRSRSKRRSRSRKRSHTKSSSRSRSRRSRSRRSKSRGSKSRSRSKSRDDKAENETNDKSATKETSDTKDDSTVSKLDKEKSDRKSRSRSRRSSSRSRSRKRSNSRGRSRSKSRSMSKSKSRSHSRSRSRSRNRSRSKSRSRSHSRSRSRSRRRSRSSSSSSSRSRRRNRRSRSRRSRSRRRSRSGSRSRRRYHRKRDRRDSADGRDSELDLSSDPDCHGEGDMQLMPGQNPYFYGGPDDFWGGPPPDGFYPGPGFDGNYFNMYPPPQMGRGGNNQRGFRFNNNRRPWVPRQRGRPYGRWQNQGPRFRGGYNNFPPFPNGPPMGGGFNGPPPQFMGPDGPPPLPPPQSSSEEQREQYHMYQKYFNSIAEKEARRTDRSKSRDRGDRSRGQSSERREVNYGSKDRRSNSIDRTSRDRARDEAMRRDRSPRNSSREAGEPPHMRQEGPFPRERSIDHMPRDLRERSHERGNRSPDEVNYSDRGVDRIRPRPRSPLQTEEFGPDPPKNLRRSESPRTEENSKRSHIRKRVVEDDDEDDMGGRLYADKMEAEMRRRIASRGRGRGNFNRRFEREEMQGRKRPLSRSQERENRPASKVMIVRGEHEVEVSPRRMERERYPDRDRSISPLLPRKARGSDFNNKPRQFYSRDHDDRFFDDDRRGRGRGRGRNFRGQRRGEHDYRMTREECRNRDFQRRRRQDYRSGEEEDLRETIRQQERLEFESPRKRGLVLRDKEAEHSPRSRESSFERKGSGRRLREREISSRNRVSPEFRGSPMDRRNSRMMDVRHRGDSRGAQRSRKRRSLSEDEEVELERKQRSYSPYRKGARKARSREVTGRNLEALYNEQEQSDESFDNRRANKHKRAKTESDEETLQQSIGSESDDAKRASEASADEYSEEEDVTVKRKKHKKHSKKKKDKKSKKKKKEKK